MPWKWNVYRKLMSVNKSHPCKQTEWWYSVNTYDTLTNIYLSSSWAEWEESHWTGQLQLLQAVLMWHAATFLRSCCHVSPHSHTVFVVVGVSLIKADFPVVPPTDLRLPEVAYTPVWSYSWLTCSSRALVRRVFKVGKGFGEVSLLARSCLTFRINIFVWNELSFSCRTQPDFTRGFYESRIVCICAACLVLLTSLLRDLSLAGWSSGDHNC